MVKDRGSRFAHALPTDMRTTTMHDPLPIIQVGDASGHPAAALDLSAIPSVEVVANIATTTPETVASALNDYPDAGLVVIGGDPRAAIDAGLDGLRPMLVAAQPGRWCDDADALVRRLSTTPAPLAGWLPARFDADCAAVDAAGRSGQIGEPVAMRIVRTAVHDRAVQQGCDVTGVVDLAMRWAGSEVASVASLFPADIAEGPATACASIVFASGATALVEAGSAATYGAADFRETVLIGTTGAFELPWDPTAGLMLTADGVTRLDDQGATGIASSGRRLVDDWVEAVRQARPAAATAADYVRACRLAWAAQRSAATRGQVVELAAPTPSADDDGASR